MTISAERLIRLLDAAREVDEWVVTETRVVRASRATGARAVRGAAEAITLGAVVFRDSEGGRGTARLWLDAESGELEHVRALVAAAAERASLAPGPAWTLPAPAAPARVTVADPDVLADPAAVVDAAVAQLDRANGRVASIGRARIDAERRAHRVETSRGFASQYESTAIGFEVRAGAVGESGRELVRGRVRSAAQLALPRRVASAARTIGARGAARPVEPARYDLVLRIAAIAHGAELDAPGAAAYGWFAPIAANAEAEWVRLGLSRYQPGHSIFAAIRAAEGMPIDLQRGRRTERAPAAAGDPLTLASDGTLDLAPLSAPFGELGEPVRRFDIVRSGTAAGLALDYREAALAHTTPNGGVRNLVLDPGPTPAARLAEPGARKLLEVDELAWLDVDPRSGALTAGLGLSQLRGARVAGGLVTGNAFELLSRARLSSEIGTLGWYQGPTAIRIDDVGVV